MTNQSVENPTGTLTYRDAEALGKHRHLGLLRYKDFDAGYCNSCNLVYGVTCPQCGAQSGPHALVNEDLFIVQRPLETTRTEGFNWTPTQCRKCDFRFKVIVHG